MGKIVDLLSDTGGVEKDVDLAKMVDDVLDCLTDGLAVTHIDTVESHVDAGLLAELLGSLVSELLLDIEDGDTADADL